MNKDFLICLLLILGVAGLLSGCEKDSGGQRTAKNYSEESQESRTEEAAAVRDENGKENRDKNAVRVTPTSEMRKNSWIHCLFPAFLPSTSRHFWSISMNWSQYLI